MSGGARAWTILAGALVVAGTHPVSAMAAESTLVASSVPLVGADGPPIIEATVFSQSTGGPVSATREWVEVGTVRGRSEDDRGSTREVATHDVVPCAEGQCSEIRRRSEDSFSVDRSADPRGSGFATTTHLVLYVVSRVDARRTMPVDAVRRPWQQLPPGAGTTARLYDVPSLGDSARPGDRTRIVVEDATGLPLVVTEVGRDGRVDGRSRWSYASRPRSRGELPSDFFLVPEPVGARYVERVEKRTAEHGGADPRLDTGTGKRYRPAVLRPGTRFRGKALCFDELRHEDSIRPLEPMEPDRFGLSPGDPLRSSSTTVVHTFRRADGTCSERGVLTGVWVRSMGRGGPEAAASASQVRRRSSLQKIWRAAGRDGRVPGGAPGRPVRLRRDGAELTFVVSTASTVIEVSGPFGLADIPRFVAALTP